MPISDPLLRAHLGRAARTLAVHRSITFVACLLRNTIDALRTWRKRRAAFHELSALSDATLKDIGLPRSQIRYVAKILNGATPGLRPCGGHGAKPVAANDDRSQAAA